TSRPWCASRSCPPPPCRAACASPTSRSRSAAEISFERIPCGRDPRMTADGAPVGPRISSVTVGGVVRRAYARFGSVRAPSLRVLAAATLPAGALVVAAVAASLIGTTRTLGSSVHELARDSRRERQVEHIETSLLRYHRL